MNLILNDKNSKDLNKFNHDAKLCNEKAGTIRVSTKLKSFNDWYIDVQFFGLS